MPKVKIKNKFSPQELAKKYQLIGKGSVDALVALKEIYDNICSVGEEQFEEEGVPYKKVQFGDFIRELKSLEKPQKHSVKSDAEIIFEVKTKFAGIIHEYGAKVLKDASSSGEKYERFLENIRMVFDQSSPFYCAPISSKEKGEYWRVTKELAIDQIYAVACLVKAKYEARDFAKANGYLAMLKSLDNPFEIDRRRNLRDFIHELALFTQDKTADENFRILRDLSENLQQRVAPILAPQVAVSQAQEQVSGPMQAMAEATPAAAPAQQNLPSKDVIDDFVAESQVIGREYMELLSLYMQPKRSEGKIASKVHGIFTQIPNFFSRFKEVMQAAQQDDKIQSLKYLVAAEKLNEGFRKAIEDVLVVSVCTLNTMSMPGVTGFPREIVPVIKRHVAIASKLLEGFAINSQTKDNVSMVVDDLKRSLKMVESPPKDFQVSNEEYSTAYDFMQNMLSNVRDPQLALQGASAAAVAATARGKDGRK